MDNFIRDSITGDLLFIDRPLTNIEQSRNLIIEVRDSIEDSGYAKDFGIEISKLDIVINQLSNC